MARSILKLPSGLTNNLNGANANLSFEKVSVHETKLRRSFDEFQVSDSIEPLDRPVCMMLFTNRSGSSVIGEHMRASNRFSGFGEPLNYKLVQEVSARENLTTFSEYLQWRFARFSKQAAFFGMKASYGQAMMLYRSGAIPNYLQDVRWVLLQRRDVLAQAISFSIAAQTNQWNSDKSSSVQEAKYDFADIKVRVRSLSESYAAMNLFCTMFGIEPYRIFYEDFAADPQSGARQLAKYLGVEDVEFEETKLKMRKQRTHRNEEFKERFTQDYYSHWSLKR